MKDRWIVKIVALLAAIAVVSLGLTAAFSPSREQEEDKVRIVTSFYPVYIAALRVTDGIDGVEVINLVDDQTGCLHDYQLSPRKREVIDSADVLVINGAGAEPFLDETLIDGAAATVIDLSAGQELLESGHVHTHEHEENEPLTNVNGHLWVSPLRYRMQIETLYTALAEADVAHTAAYIAGGQAYIKEIDAVWVRMQTAASPFTEMPTLLFHDSLAYLAEDLQLHVAAAMNVGEESGVSANVLAQATDALKGASEAMLLYDAQYTEVAYDYLQELPEKALCLSVDTAVSGDIDPDAWLNAMTALCEMWEAAA